MIKILFFSSRGGDRAAMHPPRPDPKWALFLLVWCTLSSLCATQRSDPNECLPPVPDVVLEPYLPAPPMADIVFIIDTSSSMGHESGYLINNINAFGIHLNQSGIDYRVVLVGQHASWLCVRPPLASSVCGLHGPRFLQIEQVVDSWNALQILVNTASSGTVNGGRFPGTKGTYRWAESGPTNLGYQGYADFLRPDAAKTFIVISDDDSGQYYGKASHNGKIPSHCWDNQKSNLEAGELCARSWMQDLHDIDDLDLFKPTSELPYGFAFHAISGQNCPSEAQWGYQQSWTYEALAQMANGTLFDICLQDWSPMFEDIARNVASTSRSTACTQDLPRSRNEPALLAGDLDPDTPFDLVFTYFDPRNNTAHEMIFVKSQLGNGQVCHEAAHTTPHYIVDDAATPREVSLCTLACDNVKRIIGENEMQANLTFVFKPARKLASLGGGGRGIAASSSLGTIVTVRPALTFPVHHPALSRIICNSASTLATIPKFGEAIFSGLSCPRVTGVDIFYALDPSTGRAHTFSQNFSTSKVLIFFFVNSLGETYIGLQMGHHGSMGNQTRSEYAVFDIVLSGKARQSHASWVLKDGDSISSGYLDPKASTGGGRIVMEHFKGKTAGGVLGPLPPTDFCIDVLLIEASASITSISIVDFVPSQDNMSGSTPIEVAIQKEVFDNGGIRLCANPCPGEALIDRKNSLECYTERNGKTLCPWEEIPEEESNLNSTNNTNTTLSDHSMTPAEPGLQLVWIILIAAGSLLVVASAIALIWHKKYKRDKYPETPGVALTSSNVGRGPTPNPSKRQVSCASICKSAWDLVYDPESGAQYYYNPMSGESSWTLPQSINLPERSVSYSSTSDSSGAWCSFTTDEGYTAYANKETGEVSWELPEGAHLDDNVSSNGAWTSSKTIGSQQQTHEWSESVSIPGHELEYSPGAAYSNPMHEHGAS